MNDDAGRTGAAANYFAALQALLAEVAATQSEAIDSAARAAAACVADGGMVHVFGSGHSQLVAIEPMVRAGGLGAVAAVVDPALSSVRPRRAALTERLPGYGAATMELADLRRGEVLFVVSNSGINPVPVDAALAARERGVHVVGVTSLAHSGAASPRHPSGRRLFEVADTVIDTRVPPGDTAITVSGAATGAVSTILGCAVLHAVTARTVELLAERGVEVPLLRSQNLDGAEESNARALAPYRTRLGPQTA
ncbi:putative phosphosugar-binding protein [Spinactinospora alkalitolerans]|uniref:Putative phosphosugar-binding protein n=1 Tax=Spinactinospora alkalitolerans TaxID=687207 RepID=A0A852U0V7_9ACTN|nr:sugar isomerase domain-containing protein [Spinactinospora alkalitolerans]NYE48972.1 putative phosphosugar-binding protein [Spinactinospora alkalitolerans]